MTKKIKPALTPEEWTRREAHRADSFYHEPGYEAFAWSAKITDGDDIEAGDRAFQDELGHTPHFCRHALAALCLHGRSFGFTWDDVDRIREFGWAAFDAADTADHSAHEESWLLDIADRIAALLPPRDEEKA